MSRSGRGDREYRRSPMSVGLQWASMITTIGPPARLSRTPTIPGRPVSPPGGDAAAILAMIGMADRLDELVEKRVIALG